LTGKAEPVVFEEPAIYRIVVQGRLRDDSCLGGMSIVSTSAEGEEPVTTLQGPLRDQAELSGVLNTLYEYHVSILTVECERTEESKSESE